jgi:hypothetical protein
LCSKILYTIASVTDQDEPSQEGEYPTNYSNGREEDKRRKHKRIRGII